MIHGTLNHREYELHAICKLLRRVRELGGDVTLDEFKTAYNKVRIYQFFERKIRKLKEESK